MFGLISLFLVVSLGYVGQSFHWAMWDLILRGVTADQRCLLAVKLTNQTTLLV